MAEYILEIRGGFQVWYFTCVYVCVHIQNLRPTSVAQCCSQQWPVWYICAHMCIHSVKNYEFNGLASSKQGSDHMSYWHHSLNVHWEPMAPVGQKHFLMPNMPHFPWVYWSQLTCSHIALIFCYFFCQNLFQHCMVPFKCCTISPKCLQYYFMWVNWGVSFNLASNKFLDIFAFASVILLMIVFYLNGLYDIDQVTQKTCFPFETRVSCVLLMQIAQS